jgi:hypothetical protein
MLTEHEARDLLVRAANTIEVAPAAPIEESHGRRRTWPLLAAAAAVIGLVSTAALLGPRLGDQTTTGPSAHPPAANPPASTLADDQIPSVFGYDAESAQQLLEDKGLMVTVRPSSGCGDIGRALSTEPATGTRFAPGDPVTLEVGSLAIAHCPYSARTGAWEFIDFANGRGPAPAFADKVTLYVDGQLTATLTAEQAADPANWGEPSAISEIQRESAEVDQPAGPPSGDITPEQSSYLTPFLAATYCGSKVSSCSVQAPAAYADRQSLSFGIDINTDGLFHQPLNVALYTTDGAIDTVVTSTEKPMGSDRQVEVPNEVGTDADSARASLERAGFEVEIVPPPANTVCDGPPMVGEQAPAAGTPAQRGAKVLLTTRCQ